jgi:glycosyltransferase involved in cell wall biosynthesis
MTGSVEASKRAGAAVRAAATEAPLLPDRQAGSDASPRAVSFVVPALNEEENIAGTVDEIRRAARMLDDYEIVLVNDGSSDRTGEIMNGLAAFDRRIKAVHNPSNLGLGGAYKVGIAQAGMPHVIMIPGDNCHPAVCIAAILARIGEADIVIPYVANTEVRSAMRRAISGAFTLLMNGLFRQRVPYYNGIVLHRTSLIRSVTIETDGFAYQAEALIKLLRRGASTTSVPIQLGERGDRHTRAFRLANVVTVAETIWRLKRGR